MKVSEVMSRSLVATEPHASVEDAEAVAQEGGVRHLLVFDGRDELVGVLCTCDLQGADRSSSVEHVMSAPILTIGAAEPLDEAARRMRSSGVGCLPVVSGGIVLGIITRGDLRKAGLPRAEVEARPFDDELGAGD
jgi:acetoin utilization protein AcuB